jgi:hypothetical protein
MRQVATVDLLEEENSPAGKQHGVLFSGEAADAAGEPLDG